MSDVAYLKFDQNKRAKILAGFAKLSNNDFQRAVKHAAAVMVRVAINMTPPIGHGIWKPNQRQKSKADHKSGMRAALNDFAKTNRPLVNQLAINVPGANVGVDVLPFRRVELFKKLIASKKPRYQKTWATIRKKYFPRMMEVRGTPSLAHHNTQRASRGRVGKKPLWILVTSVGKWKAEARKLAKRVGYACSGWRAAADALGVGYPAWIGDHNAPGFYYSTLTGNDKSITVVNGVSWIGGAEIGGEPARTRIPREAEFHAWKTLQRELRVITRLNQGIDRKTAVRLRNTEL